MTKILIVGMVLGLTACATSKINPTDKDPDYGPAPTDYKAQIHAYWQRTLKDPDSLQVKNITTPEKAIGYSGKESPHWYDLWSDVEFTPVYGHRVCAIYNAKNSYGGYVGLKPATFFFKNGTLRIPVTADQSFLEKGHPTGTFAGDPIITLKACE